MKKNIIACLFFMVAVLCMAAFWGCSRAEDNRSDERVSKTKTCFGTVVTITLYGGDRDAGDLIDKSFLRMSELEKIFSSSIDDSELSELNKRAYYEEVNVSDELFYVIELSLDYYKKTHGALDVTIGELVSLWGIGTEHAAVPDADKLDMYADMNGGELISLDREKKSVRFLDKRIRLDLGAVAKGYAADDIKSLLLRENSDCCGILNFGGNVMTIGSKPSGEPFTIGIADPDNTEDIYGTIMLGGESVVTSGDYERFFVSDGVTYHHILDSKTGYPARSGLSSVSIVGQSSAVCDALSTACFVLGKDKGMDLIGACDGYEALFIDEAGECFMTDGFSKYGFIKR